MRITALLTYVLASSVLLTACGKEEKIACTADSESEVYSHTEVVARVAGQEVTRKRLYKGAENQAYELEMELYKLKKDQLRTVMLDILIAQDPDKGDLTDQQFVDKYVSKPQEVSDEQVDAFVKERKIDEYKVDDQLRADIKTYISLNKQKADIDAWIDEKTADKPPEILFKKPAKPRFDVEGGSAPFIGNENAPITIVEYSDFQCPFCKRGAAVIEEVKEKYGDKVKVVFKNFPLPFHHNAFKAAEAGLCANEQSTDMFWQLHDWMFANQQNLAIDKLKAAAENLGLNTDEFNECLDSDRFAEDVHADMNEAKAAGVKSTPTFFINGKFLSGAHPIESFSELIDEDLKAK